MSSSRPSGVSRIITKLEAALDAEDYYQAHQLYRTIYFRYCAASRFTELVDLLYDGACKLLNHDQTSSGADLANLLLEVLMKSETGVNQATTLEKVRDLFSRMRSSESLHGQDLKRSRIRLLSTDSHGGGMCTGDPSSGNNTNPLSSSTSQTGGLIDRNAFIQLAVKWSKQVTPEYQYGHPNLHQQFAHVFWHEKNYIDARYHFLLSHDSEGCATFLVEYHLSQGYAGEVDLFIAQAVLQFLCHQNRHVASSAFDHYTSKHPNISGGPPYGTFPLLNFLWMLLCIVNKDPPAPLTQFTVLVEQYQPSIQRDPCYTGYLDRIGQLWFGLPPPRAQGSIFSSLLQNFMGPSFDPNDDGHSDDEHSAPAGAVPLHPTMMSTGHSLPFHLHNQSIPSMPAGVGGSTKMNGSVKRSTTPDVHMEEDLD